MADDLINEYVDRNGVRGDTDFIVSALREVHAEFKKLESIKVDLKGMGGLQGLDQTMQQAKTKADSLAASTEIVEKRMAKLNGQSKEFTETLLLQIKAENELAKTIGIKNKNSDSASKALLNEKKATADVSNAYKQLSLAYNDAALRAKNYSLTLGANHPVTVQATQDALAMGMKLKELDASTGTFNRNVGNYGNSLANYGKQAFGFIRTAANIIPGLGLSGAFLLIFKGISEAFALLGKGLDEAGRKQKFLNEVNKEAVKGYAAELTHLTLVKQKLDDLSIPLAKRKQLAEDYNKTADEGNKIDLKQLNNIDLINAAIDRQIIKIKQRATAKAAENIITQKGEKVIEDQLDLQKELEKQGFGDIDVFNELFDPLQLQFDFAKGRKKIDVLTGANLSVILSDLIRHKKEFTTALKAAGVLIDVDGLFTDTKDDKEKKDKGRDLAEANRKAQFEREKQRLEFILDINKKIADDETKHFAERYFAAGRVLQLQEDLIKLTSDFQKKEKGKTATEILQIEEKANFDLLSAKQNYFNTLMKMQKAFNKEYFEEDEKLRKDLEKGIDEAYKKLMSDYDKRREARKKDAEDKKKTEEDNLKTTLELSSQLGAELNNLAFTLLTRRIELQKNAIQQQIDKLDELKAKEIEVINQSVLNEQDKAAKIAIVEARANAKKEELQRKQKDLDIKRAKFDKAASIAKIIQSTAEAVIRYAGIPIYGTALAAIAAAIGAAQLAIVISQPIPAYKHGKNNDGYEGPAIVDDGGKPEAIIREDGSVEIGGNKPRLTHVSKRDIVLPDANQLINYVLAGHMGGSLKVNKSVPSENGLEVEIKAMKKDVVNAIRNQPKVNLQASEGGLSAMWQYGANRISYINDNTNW